MRKKGLSAVVATILIILLTVSAVAVIAGYLIPYVNRSLDSTSCTKYRDYFSFYDSGYNCYTENLQGFSIEARADKELGKEIIGFNLLLSKEGSGESVEARAGANCGDLKMYDNNLPCSIKIPSAGEVRSYLFDSGDVRYSRLRVLPVIIVKGKEMACGVSDEIQVSKC